MHDDVREHVRDDDDEINTVEESEKVPSKKKQLVAVDVAVFAYSISDAPN